MPDAASLKQDQRLSWDESAAGWKKWWPNFEGAAQVVNSRLVDLARIKAGDRVLDIEIGRAHV